MRIVGAMEGGEVVAGGRQTIMPQPGLDLGDFGTAVLHRQAKVWRSACTLLVPSRRSQISAMDWMPSAWPRLPLRELLTQTGASGDDPSFNTASPYSAWRYSPTARATADGRVSDIILPPLQRRQTTVKRSPLTDISL
ncbi:MAG: hypothetical protein M3Y58_22255 [Chloroflexota bacterium]|nr:hypothetical protein [Chloroflexota bacterium]